MYTKKLSQLTGTYLKRFDMGFYMEIHMSGDMAQMAGDWTLAGVTQENINSLSAALQQIECCSAKKLRVDCRKISAIDDNGQQLLAVWLQCARFRGAEPELVNPPYKLKHLFQETKPDYRPSGLSPKKTGHKLVA